MPSRPRFTPQPLGDEIATLRLAFLSRHPDARDRARRAREKRLADALAQRRIAELASHYVARHGGTRERLSATGSMLSDGERVVDVDTLIDTATRRAEELESDADAIASMLNEKDANGRRIGDLNLHPVEHGGTPETQRKPSRRSSIISLYERGTIDELHVAAANRIARVYQETVRATMPRISRMDAAGRPPKRSAFREGDMDATVAAERHAVYLPWIAEANARPDIIAALVMDVVIDGEALDAARRRYRIGYPKALAMLKDALGLYAKERSRWARGVDFGALREEG